MKLTAAVPVYMYAPESTAYIHGYPRQNIIVKSQPRLQPSLIDTVRALQGPSLIDALFDDDDFVFQRPARRISSNGLTTFFRDFDDAAGRIMTQNTVSLRSEVSETTTGYDISIDVPGMNANDISLQLANNDRVLKLSGSRKVEKDNIVSQSQFNRVFVLGKDADVAGISAKLSDGVLRVTVPKIPMTNHNNDVTMIEITEDSNVNTQQDVKVAASQAADAGKDDIAATVKDDTNSANDTNDANSDMVA